jgi:hypothetical protein
MVVAYCGLRSRYAPLRAVADLPLTSLEARSGAKPDSEAQGASFSWVQSTKI